MSALGHGAALCLGLGRQDPFIRSFGLILSLASVAMKGHRTKGKSRSQLNTALCRSRRLESDGSVVVRPKHASFDHLVGAGEYAWGNFHAEQLLEDRHRREKLIDDSDQTA